MADEEKNNKVETGKEETAGEIPAAPQEEVKNEELREEVSVPDKFKALVEQIEQMSVLDLNELVKVFEKKFGVSAQAAVVAAPSGDTLAQGEEKSTFTVELTDAGAQKIQVIKVVKEILGLGLKEAKDMVDGAPQVLQENVKKEDAEGMKAKIEEAGGSVALK